MVKQIEDILVEVGSFEQSVGMGSMAMGGFTGAASGWTGGGALVGAGLFGFGAGMWAAGTMARGAGMGIGYIRADPPRSNYRNPKFCTGRKFEDISQEMNDLFGHGVAAPCAPGVSAADRLYVAAANHLAVIEYRQGALIDKNEDYTERFRLESRDSSTELTMAFRQFGPSITDLHSSFRNILARAGVSAEQIAQFASENEQRLADVIAEREDAWILRAKQRCPDLPWLASGSPLGNATKHISQFFNPETDVSLLSFTASADAFTAI